MKTLNIALSKSKYFYNIPEAVDGYIFDYTPDVTEIIALENKAELKLLDILKVKGVKEKSSFFSKVGKYNVHINVYMTGFTSMLISFLNVCYSYGIEVTCYHFSKKDNKFFPQKVFM